MSAPRQLLFTALISFTFGGLTVLWITGSQGSGDVPAPEGNAVEVAELRDKIAELTARLPM